MSALSPGHFHYNKDRRMDISEDSKFFHIHVTDSQRQETIRRLKRGVGKKGEARQANDLLSPAG